MGIEERFDIPLIGALALKEKQIQQNYRPIIAVHKWFARRPGILFRGLMPAGFGDRPPAETLFRPNDFPGRVVAAPFMGGGTPLIEANRVSGLALASGAAYNSWSRSEIGHQERYENETTYQNHF